MDHVVGQGLFEQLAQKAESQGFLVEAELRHLDGAEAADAGTSKGLSQFIHCMTQAGRIAMLRALSSHAELERLPAETDAAARQQLLDDRQAQAEAARQLLWEATLACDSMHEAAKKETRPVATLAIRTYTLASDAHSIIAYWHDATSSEADRRHHKEARSLYIPAYVLGDSLDSGPLMMQAHANMVRSGRLDPAYGFPAEEIGRTLEELRVSLRRSPLSAVPIIQAALRTMVFRPERVYESMVADFNPTEAERSLVPRS